MLLEQIETKLKEIDNNCFYGAVDPRMRETLWNYIVFTRKPTRVNENKTGLTYCFSVNIVRENYIEDGLDLTVIQKMLEIAGMRLAGNDIEYVYITKPNTNIVVEMASIDFVKPVKVSFNG